MHNPGVPDSDRPDDFDPKAAGSSAGSASGDDASGDAFWQALRRELAAADAADPTDANDLPAAERLLADLDAPSERLADDRIDAMVARAMAGAEVIESSTAGPAASRRPAAVVPGKFGRLRHSPLGRPLFAAAALLLAAPGYITAATVAATVIVGTYLLQSTTDTLQFDAAIAIVMNSNEATSNRIAAQGRVAMDVIESVQLLREVAAGSDPVALEARTALLQLKHEFYNPRAFSHRPFSEPIVDVSDRVLATNGDPMQRIAAVQLLTAMAAHGISALRELQRRELAPSMVIKLQGYLANVRRWVEE